MFNVDLLQTATADLEDAYQWYEDHVQGLGNRFIKEVDHYISLIAQNPH